MADYRVARANFAIDPPEYFNYTTDVVDAWARKAPRRTALLWVRPDGGSTTSYTFAEISRRSKKAANFLLAQGIGKGDRVLVILPRVPEWYEVMLGCFVIGAVPMPGTPMLTGQDIAYRIEASEAIAVVTDAAGAEKMQATNAVPSSIKTAVCVGPGVPGGWIDYSAAVENASETAPDVPKTRSEDPLLIYFTSGTVAHPKMVLHTHASYGLGHDVTARFWQDLKPSDLHWTVSDTGWAKAGWGMLFGQWRVGCTNFVWDVRGKPDFELMLRLIQDHGVSTFCAPPTVFRSLILLPLESFDWSRLRHCVSAGEPLNPEVIDVWREATGLSIYDGYGQTETVNVVANYRCLPLKPGAMGFPSPGFVVEVVDDEGEPLGAGEEGNIAIRVKPNRPVGLFVEYWRDPEATERAFRGDWYFTGDRAVKDEEGRFWFVGRGDDVIISAGYRIGPFEVESALVEHPAVAEAAAVGVPDAARGQIVKAFVVLAPGNEPSQALAAEIQHHVRSVTAPYKYPRAIQFVDDLPKTVSGKIRRVELREGERNKASS